MRKTKFATRMLHERLSRGMNQFDFGKLVGVSAATIGQWERGEGRPSAKHLPKIPNALKVDIATVLGWFGTDAPEEAPVVSSKAQAKNHNSIAVKRALIKAHMLMLDYGYADDEEQDESIRDVMRQIAKLSEVLNYK